MTTPAAPERPVFPEADREMFERAFSDGGGGCVRRCRCGMTFFNVDQGWDWNDGELEELQKWAAAGQAREMPWAVGTLSGEFEGFVTDCHCWHERAGRVLSWILGHRFQIVELLNLKKKQLEARAIAFPKAETPIHDDTK